MNIKKIRRDTPGCHDKIFFNSAGASLMPAVVVETIKGYLEQEEQLGGYMVQDLQETMINEFYDEVAKLLNCHPRNVAFAYNATDAYAKAISSIAFNPGDTILTTDDDYVSNYIAFISLKKRFGINILRGKNLDNGDLDLEHFEAQIQQHQPRLIAVTHVPTNSGKIQDAVSVGKLCKKYDVLYLLDACQSVGQIPVDVEEIGCDFLSVTGRKFLRGPRGTGFLYASDRMLEEGYMPLFADAGGADWIAPEAYRPHKEAKRFQLWENSYAILLGLKEAVRYLNGLGVQNVYDYNQTLLKQLTDGLQAIPGIKTYDEGSQRSNIITFRKGDLEQEEIKTKLDEAGIFYSVSGINYALIDYQKKGVDWTVRFSPHYFNTTEEINRALHVVDSL
ncbi:MAG: aminotransferase class V-fold PLP-dependent enzyme [Bacteroidetes bacterium]|nr:MAG: aminotransferase class V-fold PLP-dependent enzyme [Bacteroidota bacterium]